MGVFLSVCIPAYNRAEVLPVLLDSVLAQNYDDYEIVICEDKSPEREAIKAIIADYTASHADRICYFENEKNLGYDGNIRNLIEKSSGEYCFFMGNDDLMAPGALQTVASALERHENVGWILRSYAAFDGGPENITQTFRYFDQERYFSAGAETVATFYRRTVVIPGVVLQRQAALKYSTDRFDGTLLYQLYLAANILLDMNGVFLPEILVYYRTGGVPDFGNSENEKGKFVPEEQTPESSVHFMQGMLDIALWVEKQRCVSIYRPILRDIGNYMYPILAIQARQPLGVFIKYAYVLAKIGFWRCGLFYAYFLSILLLGVKRVDKTILFIKKRLGYTPTLGNVYRGES